MCRGRGHAVGVSEGLGRSLTACSEQEEEQTRLPPSLGPWLWPWPGRET